MATKKEVAETKDQLPTAGGFDYGSEAGAGFEGTSGDDLSIPFVSILQSNSPQVEEENPPGAKAGMLYNTVTREMIPGEQGVVFLPVHKEHVFVEWVPRNEGGGFVGTYDPGAAEVKDAIAANGGQRTGKLHLPNGNELIETFYVYGLTLDDEGKETTGFGVVSFTSTKIKPCRDWTTAMYTLKGKPPMFANRARLKTVRQKNEHGTYHNFQIEPLAATWRESLIDPQAEASLLQEAREFREMVMTGMAKANHESEHSTSGVGPEGSSEDKPAF